MNDLNKLRIIYQLKSVSRFNSVGTRKESSAEHSWSCLVLADYFLGKIKQKLDKIKVYEMLMYHDLVEIYAGDVNILDTEKRKYKKEKEYRASLKLKEELPKQINSKFFALFQEFEEQKTLEAKFCKAIDVLDAEVHELSNKKDWKGWTEKIIREKMEFNFKEFPEVKVMFEEVVSFARENSYFDQ